MAAYTNLEHADLNEILSLYGLEMHNYSPITAGNSNSNYRIETKEESFVLTMMEEKPKERIEKFAKLLNWLNQHDFKTSFIQLTLKGELVTEFTGKPLLLKKWISGEVYEYFEPGMFQQIGNTLASLHTVPVPDFLPVGYLYGLAALEEVKMHCDDLEFKNWLTTSIHSLENKLPKNLPKGIIHGDLFYDNILFEGDQLKAVIDFEEASHYFLIFDLAMAILGTCQTAGQIDLVKSNFLIKGYEEIRQLTEKEKEYFSLFIQHAAIATSCWRFWKYNIATPNPKNKNKHREMMQLAMDASLLNKQHFF